MQTELVNNLNWLWQYVRESQARYPSISETAYNVIFHLLYVNGNGVPIKNGNPVREVSFFRTIPFQEYYRDQKSFMELAEFLDEMDHDEEIDEEMDRLKILNDVFKEVSPEKVQSEDEMWDLACSKWDDRYDDITPVDDILDRVLDPDYIRTAIQGCKYPLKIEYLSRGFYLQSHFTKDTDPDLLKFAIIFSRVLIEDAPEKARLLLEADIINMTEWLEKEIR